MPTSAIPPPREPVKPTAFMRGSATRADPVSISPSRSENTPSGKPDEATAAWIACADEFARSGVRRVAFHHDGTAGRQRRSGVAARDRKGEREVAGAEHSDRTQADVAQPQVHPRQRLSLGQGMVDTQIEPFAPAHHVGKELKLANRSGALALDASPREPGLGARPFDESVPKT